MKKKKVISPEALSDYLGCLGHFNARDKMCFRHCALSLRCAIDSNYFVQAEIMEEMIFSEMFSEKMQ